MPVGIAVEVERPEIASSWLKGRLFQLIFGVKTIYASIEGTCYPIFGHSDAAEWLAIFLNCLSKENLLKSMIYT